MKNDRNKTKLQKKSMTSIEFIQLNFILQRLQLTMILNSKHSKLPQTVNVRDILVFINFIVQLIYFSISGGLSGWLNRRPTKNYKIPLMYIYVVSDTACRQKFRSGNTLLRIWFSDKFFFNIFWHSCRYLYTTWSEEFYYFRYCHSSRKGLICLNRE